MASDINNLSSQDELESISILIQQTREGHDSARTELLKQMQDYIQLMANIQMDRTLRGKLNTSDVAQQTMAIVIEKIDGFKGRSSAEFRGWLKAIIINEVNNVRRKFWTGKRDISRERPIDASMNSRVASPQDGNPTPSTAAIAAEKVNNFYAILCRLPEDYADVIRFRSIEQMSFQQIAEKMQRTPNAVTKLWYRAVLKFEEELRESGLPFESQQD